MSEGARNGGGSAAGAIGRRRLLRGLVGAGFLATAGPLLVGCGDDNGEAERNSGAVTVRMGDAGGQLVFMPDRVRIQPGETVEWVVQSAGHSATAYHPQNHEGYGSRIPDGAEPWSSGLLAQKGARFRHTFTAPGIYHYYCIPHEGAGMVGAVVVGAPADGPASAPVQQELPEAARRKLEELIAWARSQRS